MIKYLDLSREENYPLILDQKPALVWIETPTNPLLKILSIEMIANYTHRCGASLVVDNTFASPIFQKPLDIGADLSLASTTKYINGHSDCLGGVVTTSSECWQEKMIFAQKAVGLNPSPWDTWLISRGVKTIALRMDKHHQNAIAFATFLEKHSCVNQVYFPYLPSHPQHHLATRQMSGGSGIVTAEMDLSLEDTKKFLASFSFFALAESLGGVESLVCHPASMTHASIPQAKREAVGIQDGLVRFSVGIEHCDDLIEDFHQAISVVNHE